ncbi:MAG: efflux RND transporter permease subunit [Bacteroidia bacterium]|nr:efflux RND transporter permease subunit [Bacteroidia bacterium]
MTLTEIAIKRPSLIIVIFAVLGLLGTLSYFTIGYELLPKFNAPVVTVITVYPGASPSEVESGVSKIIEDGLSSLENVKRMSTISAENMSSVVVELAAGADVDLALQDAQRKVNQVLPLLPSGAKAPVIGKFGSDEFPTIQMGATSDLSPSDFFQLIKDDIKPQIASIKGVADIGIVGGEERAVRVNLNPQQMESKNISMLQVVQAINNANMDFPTGKVKTEGEQLRIHLAGKFASLEELRELVIAQFPGGSVVKLRDIGEAIEDKKETATINRINGKTAVGIILKKQSDANAVEVSRMVKAKIAEMEKRYQKENIKFTIASDASDFTLKAADAVKHDLVLAIFLVALVILIFLHSIRDSFIVMLSIPASFVSTFIAFYIFDFTFNLMTLLGLTLVVGILVDDSIVVLENIHRHLHMGKDRKTAALDGRNEIGFTALSITLVDVVVFLPLALSNAGIISDILRQFSWVIVISTMMSLFVSFTVTPFLASRFSKKLELDKTTLWGKLNQWLESQVNGFTNWYIQNLKWTLNNKKIVLPVIFLMFVGSCGLIPAGLIGNEFVKEGDKGECIINVELEKTSTLENTNKFSQKAEEILRKMPEVTMVFANVGGSSSMEVGKSGNHKAELNIKLVDKKLRPFTSKEFIEKAKKVLTEAIPGAKITGGAVGIAGGDNQAPIQLIISGENPDSVIRIADFMKEKVRRIAGTADVELSVESGVPEVTVDMDKEKLAAYGLNVAMVGGTLQAAFAGNDASKFRKGTKEYDIVIMLDGFNRKNIEDVKNIGFVNQMGQKIKLSQFAEVKPGTGPSKYQRTNRQSSVTLSSQLVGSRALGDVSKDIDNVIKEANFPSNITIAYIGAVENQAESFSTIGIAFLISIVLVYLIMVALYDNYIYPFVVLFAIPVALIGALLALALTGNNLSLFTMLGMVMMVGLVSKNAILIVDFANHLKENGMNTYEALLESGKERLRPILMTTLAMVLGMIPVATATTAGSEWKNGLGWALIGGLTSSMFLTLLVVPAVYMIVDNVKDYFGKRKGNPPHNPQGVIPQEEESLIRMN